MNFDLNDDQVALRETARTFAEEHIAPSAARNDRKEIFPSDILDALRTTGLMTPTMPGRIGGSNADYIGEALVFEEIGRICSSIRTILSVHNSLCALTIKAWGTDEQKERFLPELARGRTLGCFALTEFTAGSEATNQNLMAEKDGDGWLLNGRKAWVSSGTKADICLLFAQTNPEIGYRGIAAYLVPTDSPGFEAEKVEGKTGLRSAHTAHLTLKNLRLSDQLMLGKVGQGFKVAMSALDNGRYGVAAGCVGQAQACLEASVQFAKERSSFGKPIASKQLIQGMLADMATAVDGARLLVYRAGHAKNQGRPNTYETSVAKLVATETAVDIARKAIQIHGAGGYTAEYPVERHLRDALATTIYEGTSQIQKLIIGRHLTGESAFA